MSAPRPGLVFARLHLPRPLDPQQVQALFTRLAADHAAPTLVFEARSSVEGIEHLFGVAAEHARWTRRTLRDLLPGLDLETLDAQSRTPVRHAAQLRIRPRSLALASGEPEQVSRAMLSALNAKLAAEETLVVQLVLGPRRPPAHLPARPADPTQPWWQLLTTGTRQPAKPVRDQIDQKVREHGFAAALRIGVTATTPERARRLVIGMLGALSTAQGRGVYLDLHRDSPTRVAHGSAPWRWPLHLSVSDVVGMLAWPLGDTDLPGVAPLHPRLLRVPAGVSRTERVFAHSAGPGPTRPVGLAASDSLGHLLALGPTGSGKSTALLHLIKADIANGRAVLVIDPKRQLIDDIIERAVPEHRIDDVVIIDPADKQPVGFNPLDIGNRDPDVVVDGLVAVFAAVFHSGWGPRTQDIVHSSLLTLARSAHHRGRGSQPFTLLDLPRLLSDARFRATVVGARC